MDESIPRLWTARKWMDPVTEDPAVGATELWEIYNTTADAHPMHIHETVFEVVNREGLALIGDEVVHPIRAGRHNLSARALGNGLQGHGRRLSRPGDPRQGPVQHPGPVRLALSHRGARGQRDDAPYRIGASAGGSPGSMKRRMGYLVDPDFISTRDEYAGGPQAAGLVLPAAISSVLHLPLRASSTPQEWAPGRRTTLGGLAT